tara:strand:+ start:14835 stop:15071 length:237 start_codon:yes stop_codon:yes gene_type:complete
VGSDSSKDEVDDLFRLAVKFMETVNEEKEILGLVGYDTIKSTSKFPASRWALDLLQMYGPASNRESRREHMIEGQEKD